MKNRGQNLARYYSVIVAMAIALTGGLLVGCSGSKTIEEAPTAQESQTVVRKDFKKEDAAKPIAAPAPDVPTEYTSALTQADTYANTMHMSKQGLYDQLTSEYGGQFSEEAAQYAVDNVQTDWNANALASADSYASTMHMSKQGVYDQLISEYGEQFTPEEAQYAIDNVQADWNENALATAEQYQDTMSMSPEAIRDQLTSEYGEKFTDEEAEYAVSNLS